MLLLFPSGLTIVDTCTVRSINKKDFDKKVMSKKAMGWEVEEMYTKYRKTLFGGVVSYFAEFKRGKELCS